MLDLCRFMFIVVLASAVSIPAAAQQTDIENFTMGRLALDKYKDCAGAVQALEKVSPATREREALWSLYMSKAYECIGSIPLALTYYEKYATFFPGEMQIVEKLAELRYLAERTRQLSGEWASTSNRDFTARDGRRVHVDTEDNLNLFPDGDGFAGTVVTVEKYAYPQGDGQPFTVTYSANISITKNASGLVGQILRANTQRNGEIELYEHAYFEKLELLSGLLTMNIRFKTAMDPVGVFVMLKKK